MTQFAKKKLFSKISDSATFYPLYPYIPRTSCKKWTNFEKNPKYLILGPFGPKTGGQIDFCSEKSGHKVTIFSQFFQKKTEKLSDWLTDRLIIDRLDDWLTKWLGWTLHQKRLSNYGDNQIWKIELIRWRNDWPMASQHHWIHCMVSYYHKKSAISVMRFTMIDHVQYHGTIQYYNNHTSGDVMIDQ